MKTSFAFLVMCFLFLESNAQTKSPVKNYGIVIHGGAGTILKKDLSPELERQYTAKLQEALDSGYAILDKNGTSLDAVVAAIKVMEDSRLFNAGSGSVFTSEGKNEMDAAIMDGKTLKAGAVACIRTIKNPITAARCVMDKSPHVMLSGPGADLFAKQCGCVTEDSAYFFTEKRWTQLIKAKEQEKLHPPQSDTMGSLDPSGNAFNDRKFGTVGAVALDKN